MSSNKRFDPSINYYAVLDVPLNASSDEIRRTYRGLMRVTHPDNFTEPVERLRAEERSKLINAAYTVLSRPDMRKEYDRMMRHQLMAEVVKQRYTGSRPSRPSATRRQRPPSSQTVRVRRSAYRSAVWQLIMTTAAVVFGLIVFIIVGALALNGLQTLF